MALYYELPMGSKASRQCLLLRATGGGAPDRERSGCPGKALPDGGFRDREESGRTSVKDNPPRRAGGRKVMRHLGTRILNRGLVVDDPCACRIAGRRIPIER